MSTVPHASPSGETLPALAVSYLRVSTKEQAEKGGSSEGFSIPAQREVNRQKAADLGARIVREFVDAGESAKTADRDELQAMLAHIKTHQVHYVIVPKVNRLARNRADDVAIHEQIIAAGARLASVTENIDDTPSGALLHGVMSSIAESYSRNLATEVVKGLTQKVAQGGTPMLAPIGYLNVRSVDANGREQRTVKIDPDRARLITWAFEQYATGETTVVRLLQDVTARGLTAPPRGKKPERAISRNTMYRILENPYCAGVIRYKGALHPGSHEPIISQALFDKVQTMLVTKNVNHIRQTSHTHYLKGMLFCGVCGARMIQDFATNRHGTTYACFVCNGKAKETTGCTRRAVPVQLVERLVTDTYHSLTISEQDYRTVAERMHLAFDERNAGRASELADLAAQRAKLEAESEKLLAAHFADAISLDQLKRHQDRIRAGLADIDRRLAEHDQEFSGGRAFLDSSLRLLTDAHRMYDRSGGTRNALQTKPSTQD